ncbi:cobaltochelatase CobT-related protein [Bradyrhizobium aeschynomenes]|uniref:cobaltochelatase CobT-related protein n=1 Tax=Bradyrhizobium aeschynomenes TaxID=2734909 RepID=UPI001FEDF164|nr:hypothetical protein [Bradyrhizobium aeschynomenes]
MKENIAGEAIAWASARLRQRAEPRKFLIVPSDGAPVDDSTLSENGESYLHHHLAERIRQIEAAGDIRIAAIGIGQHPVDRYYGDGVMIGSPRGAGEHRGGCHRAAVERKAPEAFTRARRLGDGDLRLLAPAHRTTARARALTRNGSRLSSSGPVICPRASASERMGSATHGRDIIGKWRARNDSNVRPSDS